MYREALVSFIDILGFKDLVTGPEADFDKVKEALDQLRTWGKPDLPHYVEKGYQPTTIQFSDCMVRVRHVDSEANSEFPYGMLFHELLDLSRIQYVLATMGIFIRGGVSFGNIYIDPESEQVFGPAMVRSYEIESREAIHPRIVVDNDALLTWTADPRLRAHDSLQEEWEYIQKFLQEDNDKCFVNYLETMFFESDDTQQSINLLSTHKEKIVEQLDRANLSDRVRQKFVWLSDYHNSVIQRLIVRCPGDTQLTNSELLIVP